MFLVVALMMAAPAAAQPVADMRIVNPNRSDRMCPETPMSVARKMGEKPMRAIPLTELPPGKAYMAVDRRINGCPAPMTAIEYRAGNRR